MFDEEIRTFLGLRPREIFKQVVNLGLVVCSALVMWETFMVVLNSESPVVVVLSESMAPGYERGDLLLLNLWDRPVRVGDVVVFKQSGREIPIVHRVLRVHVRAADQKTFILTKGDNNPMDDRVLYPPGQEWISQQDLMGRSMAYLPYVGFLTIWMTENVWLKFVVIGLLGFFVLTGKEDE
jgi:signal peptidase